MKTKQKKSEVCDICYQIRCKACGWIADEESTAKIQLGKLTACPVCGWKPGESGK